MSGVLRLDQTARLFHGGAEMAEVWMGGVRVWRADTLAQYYGVGPGQVPGDWRIDEATVVAGEVTAVRNDGGAGAAFNLAQRGTLPLPTRSGLYMVTGGGKQLALANPADLVGVHFLGVLDSASTGSYGALFARNTGTIENYYEFRASSVAIRSGAVSSTINYTQPGGPALYEMRWDGTLATLLVNGSVAGSVTTPTYTTWPASWVGGGRGDRPAHGFTGPVGRCVSVIMAAGFSATAPERAVLVARQTLAAQYGITLP